MYPKLNEIINCAHISGRTLAKVLDVPYVTMLKILNGTYEITFKDAKILKAYLKTDLPLEELFATKEELG